MFKGINSIHEGINHLRARRETGDDAYDRAAGGQHAVQVLDFAMVIFDYSFQFKRNTTTVVLPTGNCCYRAVDR